MKRHVVWPALVAALVAPAFLRGEGFHARDMAFVYAPLRQFVRTAWLNGTWPAWYPYDGLGQPTVGMTVGGLFHPLTLLLGWLPPLAALDISVLTALVAALTGAAALGRRWWPTRWTPEFFAVAWGFGGYLLSMSNNLLYLVGLATVPWVLYAVDRALTEASRGWAVAAAALWASMLLAGDLYAFLLVAVPVGLAAWLRTPAPLRAQLPRLAPVALGTAGLAAVQLLPSARTAGTASAVRTTLDASMTWSVHPVRWAEVVLGPLTASADDTPRALTDALYRTAGAEPWAASIHVGLLTATLALVLPFMAPTARRRLAIAAVPVALLVWLMLGRWGGLWPLLWEWFSPFRLFRTPEKLFPFVALALCVAAATTLHLAQRAGRERLISRALLAAGVAAALAAVLSSPLVTALTTPALSSMLEEQLRDELMLQASIGALAALVLAALWRFRPEWAPALTVAAAAAISLVQAWPTLRTAPREALEGAPPWASVVREGEWGRFSTSVCGGQRSLAQSVDHGCTGTPGWWGLAASDFYFPAFNERIFSFDAQTNVYYPLVGTRFLLARAASVTNHTRYVTRWEGGDGDALFEDRAARPQAWLARAFPVEGRDDAEALLATKRLRWATDAIVEDAHVTPAPEGWTQGTARVVRDDVDVVEVEAVAPAPSVLVLNGAWYPGWEATVADAAADVFPANLVLRGVAVPAGTHRVVLRYTQPGLQAGAIISLASLAALLAWWRVGRRRQTAPLTSP